MGQRPKDLDPTASPGHYLGSEMRAWRNSRSLSLAQLGRTVCFDASYMARVERGQQTPSADLVTAYDQATGANGALARLHQRIANGASLDVLMEGDVAKTRGHVAKPRGPLDVTTTAEAPSEEGISVPVRTDDGRIVFVELSRRTLLGALGAGAALAAMPETAAALSVPSSLTMPGANPLEHLQATRRLLIDNDNLFGPHKAIPVAKQQIAAIKELRQSVRGDDRRRLIQLQTQYSELVGWFYQDIGDYRAAKHWTLEALEAAQMSGDPELGQYVLARRSQLAGDMADHIEAVDVAEAAEDLAAPGSRLAVIAATYGAHGHALRKDAQATHAAYAHARELFASMDSNPASPWGVWLDASYIDVHEAHSLALVGEHAGAIEGFERAIRSLPAQYHRDRGVYLARQAAALGGAGEPEQAATVGLHALSIGVETGSARISQVLAQVDVTLNQWRSVPAVAEFKESMTNAVLRAHS